MNDGSAGSPTSRRRFRTTVVLAVLAAVIFWRLARREPVRGVHSVKASPEVVYVAPIPPSAPVAAAAMPAPGPVPGDRVGSCLQLSAGFQRGIAFATGSPAFMVEVHAFNRCDEDFRGDLVGFTVLVDSVDGGLVGRAKGNFDGLIRRQSDSQALVGIGGDPGKVKGFRVDLASSR